MKYDDGRRPVHGLVGDALVVEPEVTNRRRVRRASDAATMLTQLRLRARSGVRCQKRTARIRTERPSDGCSGPATPPLRDARDERVGPAYDGAAEEAARAAVVAHGLFSPLAVLRGAAFAVHNFGGSLSGAEYKDLTDAVISQSEVLTEGLDPVLRFCSAQFADAAWVIESIGRSYRNAASEDHEAMLDQLDAAAEVLSDGLRALVQGLPPEVRALLDQLRDRT